MDSVIHNSGANISFENDTIQTLSDASSGRATETVKTASAQESLLVFETASQFGDFSHIPKCVLNCVYPLVLQHGCSHLDHICFCSEIGSVLYDLEVQSCLEECPFLGGRSYARGSITEFCEADSAWVKFPPYILEINDLYRRQASGFTSSEIISQSVPPATIYLTTTTTSTLPWGSPASTYTQTSGTTVLVVDAVTDTVVLTTFLTTTIIPSGQNPFTSTFTDPNSAAITEIIGVTTTSTAETTSTSSSTAPTSIATGGSSSKGLSTGSKIGIGIAIPLFVILLALAIVWYIRRRKKNGLVSSIEPEQNDGGLPEPTTNIQELAETEKITPNVRTQLEADGSPVHELDSSHRPSRHELSSNTAIIRTELHDSPSDVSHELSTSPVQQHKAVSASSPLATSPKAVPSQPIASEEQSASSFPQPWENPVDSEFGQSQQTGLDEESEAAELARLEEEVARVRQKRERLQELQALETREEELERSIQEKKNRGPSNR
ncbi:hypothetical protein EG329_011400 [Mollisiaceae sp. DMI_Dod_QoI]|nr:hypothetical protein EG329_011400 [Helotiales sp. DMI_Dod_QoI]